jgi:hypothetical protein
MTRVRAHNKGVSSPSRNSPKITNSGDQDPQTVVGLIYRLTGDPVRVLVLIGLSAALSTC